MRRYVLSALLVCFAMSSVSSGTWLREKWNRGATGGNLQSILDIIKGSPPDEVVEVNEPAFDALGSNYVARLSGWLTVPQTGSYTFYLASDDYGSLFLSPDEQMANAVQIAEVPGWTNAQEWTTYPQQRASPVALKEGQMVAIFAVMQQGGGGDNLAIGWSGPGIQGIALITDGVTDIPPVPGVARIPVPAREATDVPRDTKLAWIPGKYAKTHDVYLGAVFEEVNNASRTDPRNVLISRGQDANTFDPVGLIEFGQTYYWRVDEVNAAPDFTLFKGTTWSFAAEPYAYPVKPIKATASSSSSANTGPEKTVDGSGLNAQDEHGIAPTDMWISKDGQDPVWIQYEFDREYVFYQMWVWNANQDIELDYGLGAMDVTVEYSMDGSTWATLAGVPQFNQATGDPSYVHNTTVEFVDVHARFVRLTITSNWGGMLTQYSLSEVRFLQVPLRAYGPHPGSGATGVALDQVLSWRPGREAVKHQVYLGTDPIALTLVNTGTAHSLDLTPLGLQYGKTYYWKVNEVNEAQTPSSWEGDLWSFTSIGYRVVEDFESYDDLCNRIYYSWVDGAGTTTATECGGSSIAGNGSGATVGNDIAPYAEQTIVHSGRQALPVFFDNTKAPYYSEAQREWAMPQAWTGSGVKNLVVYLQGKAAGFVEVSPGTFLMNGEGTWEFGVVNDTCRYSYRNLNGDGTIVARVDRVGDTHPWAVAGVMIRDTLDQGSAYACVFMTPENGINFHRRLAVGAGGNGSTTAAAAVVKAPYWVKLTRKGDAFTAQYSANGTTWVDIPATPGTLAVQIQMQANVYIGLVVAPRGIYPSAARSVCEAKFSNVSVTPTSSVSGDWQTMGIGGDQNPGNALDTFYVAVQDSAGKIKVMSNPDRTLIATGSWEKWSIPLSQLTSAGVNLNSVKKVVLGVGDRSSPTIGGTGTLYIDDIRLEP